jgi:hypothetical protein
LKLDLTNLRLEAMKHCSKCGSLYIRERRIGLFESRILPMVALKHFECLSCCKKFYGFGSGNLPVNRGQALPPMDNRSVFLESEGERSFETLVKDLRAAERRMRQGFS